MDRRALATFLRSRRERLTPAAVGLPADGPRRTPGLRREEVARLAYISVAYYVRLEQARGPRPSRRVLSALHRALRLTDNERAHLFIPESLQDVSTQSRIGLAIRQENLSLTGHLTKG